MPLEIKGIFVSQDYSILNKSFFAVHINNRQCP